MIRPTYNDSVFINCPFDDEYKEIFVAIIFCIFDCGYVARCSKELGDSSEIRIDKISRIISECKYAVHDISRTEPDAENELPRFNMPLELGLFLGAKRFGDDRQKRKSCVILDTEPYRFQKFISDISGQDIETHNNDSEKAVKIVRNWLSDSSRRRTIPGGKEIWRRYKVFTQDLPTMCEEFQFEIEDLTFLDYTGLIYGWLEWNPPRIR